jgi:four helix bundle protein
MKTELEGRTKEFSVRIVRLLRAFPKTVDGIEVGRQLLRSGTSIGANYREANRAESKPDFVHQVGLAEKAAAKAVYWLEICEAAPLGEANKVRALLKAALEIMAIVTTTGRKAKGQTIRAVGAIVSPITFALGCFVSAFALSRFPLFF